MLDLFAVATLDIEPELRPDITVSTSAVMSGTEFARSDKKCWYPDEPPPDLSLVRRTIELIDQLKPRWWLIENVRGAIPWFRPLLGAPFLRTGSVILWGKAPLILLSRERGRKENQSRRSDDPRVANLGSFRRRQQLRAVIPYEISLAIAKACEGAT